MVALAITLVSGTRNTVGRMVAPFREGALKHFGFLSIAPILMSMRQLANASRR